MSRPPGKGALLAIPNIPEEIANSSVKRRKPPCVCGSGKELGPNRTKGLPTELHHNLRWPRFAVQWGRPAAHPTSEIADS